MRLYMPGAVGLENTIVARNGSRKNKQRKAKTKMGEIQHIIYTFGTMAAASRVAEVRVRVCVTVSRCVHLGTRS